MASTENASVMNAARAKFFQENESVSILDLEDLK